MIRPPIRAVTIGIAERHPIEPRVVEGAADLVRRAAAAYTAGGYEVQTLRLSMRSMLEDLAGSSSAEITTYADNLQTSLNSAGISFCSVGTAPAWRQDFVAKRVEILADVLIANPSLNATVQIAWPGHELRRDGARHAARIIQALANQTDEGLGNFRFAALACVSPGSPFFPAGYHDGPASLAIGWQGASIVRNAVDGTSTDSVEARIIDAVAMAGGEVVEVGQRVARDLDVIFGGLDISPAPAGADSIGAAIELLSDAPVGAPGTLTAARTITAALQGTDLPTCGYSGLMLPIMEDGVLADRWAGRALSVHALLAYSAICGTGLDAVPLPGNVSEEELSSLILDVGSLALRLGKPLSARLMPAPGMLDGDWTNFSSPYLVNSRVWSLTRPEAAPD